MKIFDIINERKRVERRKQKVDTAKKVAIGSVIGALAGILFAPKAGKEIRRDISQKTKEVTEATKKTLKELEEKVKDEVKSKVDNMKDRNMFEIDLTAEDKKEEADKPNEVVGE